MCFVQKILVFGFKLSAISFSESHLIHFVDWSRLGGTESSAGHWHGCHGFIYSFHDL